MFEEQEAFIESAIYLMPLILIMWTIALNGRPTILYSFVGTYSVIELSELRNELGVRKKQEGRQTNISGLAQCDSSNCSALGRRQAP